MDADSYSVRSQFRGLGWPRQAAWLLRENFVSRIQRNSNAAVQMPGWPRPEGVPVSAEEQGAGLQRSIQGRSPDIGLRVPVPRTNSSVQEGKLTKLPPW